MVAKAVFLIYHFPLAKTLSATETFKVFFYGLKMDSSFTGYICILPFFLFLAKSFLINIPINKIIRIYTFILVIFISFLTIADLELYTAWGFRMDATPLQYFKSPAEMGATVSSAPVFKLLVIFAALAVLFIFIYKKYFNSFIDKKQKKIMPVDLLISTFLFAFLFVPIRGGFQKIPMNISDVYFSEKLFADHAAINLPWNITFSILNKNNDQNPFDYFQDKTAGQLVDSLYNTGL